MEEKLHIIDTMDFLEWKKEMKILHLSMCIKKTKIYQDMDIIGDTFCRIKTIISIGKGNACVHVGVFHV